MEELEKVVEALEVVERYEAYLFQKAWGKSLITIGLLTPLGVLVLLSAEVMASILGWDIELAALIASLMTVLFIFGLVIFFFGDAWTSTTKRRTPTERKRSLRESGHGFLIAVVWFVMFCLTSFAPEPLRVVSLLWAASASCLLSYLIFKLTPGHESNRGLLFLGVMLAAISIPIVAIQDIWLANIIAAVVFSAIFILGGTFTLRGAGEHLREGQSP